MVKVTDEDLDILYFTVCIDSEVEQKKANKFAEDIEGLLNRRAYKLVCAMHKPLPAHVVAALEPIHAHAVALAALLDSSSISSEVQNALDVPQIDDGHAWDLVTRIGIACQVAITSLKSESRSGLHKKQYSQALQYATELFIDFFESTRSPSPEHQGDEERNSEEQREYDDDKKEFLALCLKYLPDMSKITNANSSSRKK